MDMRKPILPQCSLPYSLFFLFFLFYILTNSGHLGTYDAAMEYEVAKNLIQSGSFELRDEQFHEFSAARGRDGKLYSPHGLGQSLVMIPFFLLGEGASQLFPHFPKIRLHHFCITLMNPMVMALTCLVLYFFQRRLRFRERSAVVVTSIFGICTIAFPYAKVSFDVTLTAFLLLSAGYSIYRFQETYNGKWALFSGILIGFSLLTRIASLLVVPIFTFYFFYSLKRTRLVSRRIGQLLILYGLPIVMSVIIVGWYNDVRFGAFYEDGHATDAAVKLTTPFFVGLLGQLVSPGKGLFFYSPILLFSFFGIKKLYHTHSWEVLLFGCIICVNLFFYSKLVNWSGDWCWGPRFTVPLVPLFTIFIGAFLNGSGFQGRSRLKKVWILLIVFSVAIQVLGVTIDGTRRIGHRYTSDTITSTEIYWNPVESPLVDHVQLIPHVSFNPTRYSLAESHGVEKISYEDTTADFWFVYMYSIGFPLKWILASLSILIVFHFYFGYSLFHTVFGKCSERC